MKNRIFKVIFIIIFSVALQNSSFGISKNLVIKGFGILDGLQIKRTLDILDNPKDQTELISASMVEDALWILDGEVRAKGYLYPTFSVQAVDLEGRCVNTEWYGEYSEPLPHDAVYCSVTIIIHAGTLYFFESIEAEGLPCEFTEDIKNYFYNEGFLFVSKKDRIYTPNLLNAGLNKLRKKLKELGYYNVNIPEPFVAINDKTNEGAVCVFIDVQAGPKYFVRNVNIYDQSCGDVQTRCYENQVYNNKFVREVKQDIRRQFFCDGYPDVFVDSIIEEEFKSSDEITFVDLKFTIRPGQKTYINEVHFINASDLNPSLLRGRIPFHSGDVLNVLQTEAYRNRVSKLGVYESVILDYKDVNSDLRDVIYYCRPRKKLSIKAIMGYGTYEQLRGGLEIDRNNLFGRAHKFHGLAMQSFKSTNLEGLYTIPEVFCEDISLYGKVHYLRREEPNYETEDLIGTAGLERYYPKRKMHLALQYNFEKINTSDEGFTRNLGRLKSQPTSLEFIFLQNRLDNPLMPEEGFKLFGSLTVADQLLGGNVSYQLLEGGISYHYPLTPSFIIHLGLKHGFLTAFRDDQDDIPISKRFLLGGDTTVRGYHRGKASSRDVNKKIIGDASYTLVNIELQQKIISNLSAVVFCDIAGVAKLIKDYPFNKSFISVGAGIYFHTLIGPLRLYYATNINPGKDEPEDSLNIALGFPF